MSEHMDIQQLSLDSVDTNIMFALHTVIGTEKGEYKYRLSRQMKRGQLIKGSDTM